MGVLSAVVFALIAQLCRAVDFSYDQDISFRSTYNNVGQIAEWDTLPFNAPEHRQSFIHLGRSNDCFLVLSGQSIYAAPSVHKRNKITLSSPYLAWQQYADVKDDTKIIVASRNDKYSFFSVTTTNVVAFTVENNGESSCGKVAETFALLNEEVEWGVVVASASSNNYIFVASSNFGLSQISISDGHIEHIELEDTRITSLEFIPEWERLFVGTISTLYTFAPVRHTERVGDYQKVQLIQHEWITGVIDSPPLQFTYDPAEDCVWLAQQGAIHRLDKLGRWWRYGYHQGLPMGNITSVAVIPAPTAVAQGVPIGRPASYVYAGSRQVGIARVRGNGSPTQSDTLPFTNVVNTAGGSSDSSVDTSQDPWNWLSFSGQRYLTDNNVITMVSADRRAGDSSVVLVATQHGISFMETASWHLSEKAEAMQQFQYPRHDRHKLTSSCGLSLYGGLSTYYKKVSDNDGLWTAMHGMGEAYSAAATGSEQSRKEAWRAFEGLEMLSNVTGGYPNFVARSFCYVDDGASGCGTDSGEDRWHLSENPLYPGVMWKDDTSSDELDGHLAVYPLILDMVAQTPDEKQRVITLIDGITGGIVKNDLYFIDPTTGAPTTWGFFNPTEVNDNPDHYSERGTNSIGMLAYLASAYSVTRKDLYKAEYKRLSEEFGYIRNCMNVKIDNPDDDNHSDNELISLAYHIMFYSWRRISAEDEPEFKEEMWEMVQPLMPSLERSWQIYGTEYSPLWTGVFAGVAGALQTHSASKNTHSMHDNSADFVSRLDVSRSVWSLRHWAVDLITWPIDNTLRYDTLKQPFHVRDSTKQIMRNIRPPSERISSHWNHDPFSVEDSGGYNEYEPSVWRLPYFMMLYYKLI